MGLADTARVLEKGTMRPPLTLDALLDEAAAFAEYAGPKLAGDEIDSRNIAEEVLQNPPEQDHFTIFNALRWRLQYGRTMQAGRVPGLKKVR